MSQVRSTGFDWARWFQWVMGTTLGWLLGSFILPGIGFLACGIAIACFQWLVLIRHISFPWRWALASSAGWFAGWLAGLAFAPGDSNFLAAALLGLTTGFAQWLILRREVQWSGWWIVVSVIAWTTGLVFLPGIFLSGMMAGVVTGTALELLLLYPLARKQLT